ncbi:hypothetical protein PCANC_10927 [Puccinia coronata f. sp. avenae]|uniref:Uncharacterized protein n=1 Tax=Puccinia coronata f. sp. avenae TaxID=200324 RepID=A0A2N5SZV7_9BASI|nr:hypothetical protein PCANC_10927 [Puccinia coronata f. sp. avenae]PLW45667.1 hypothetical protein PCASD_07064 [Puccinia coronata f. sp. avenae]
MHKAEANAEGTKKRKRQQSPPATSNDSASDHNTEQEDALDHNSEVGGIKFTTGAVPKHDDMGFTPYFNKNCRKLRGPIPLTIFNKKWKNTAIIHHAEKH